MKFILCLIFTLIFFKIDSSKYIVFKQLEKQENYYQKTIEFIKSHEFFVDSIYKCPAGYNTIGYGHLITEKDTFKRLTKLQAENLLKSDFEKCLKYVDTVQYPKNIAIAHFIYSLGIGTYLSIRHNFKDNVLKYCYYKKDSTYIYSELAFKMRKFELELFEK